MGTSVSGNAIRSNRLVFSPGSVRRESALFILVSVLDLYLTCLLIGATASQPSGMVFYERNPIAGFFLINWGMEGLIAYKFMMIAFIAIMAQCIALGSVRAARRVLNFGNGVISIVLIYSAMLLLRSAGQM